MSWPRTRLSDLLGTEIALIQAPMAGSAGPALVAEVSRCGALGSLGAGYSDPDTLREQIRGLRKLTDRPFAVNLMAHQRAVPLPPNDVLLDDQLDVLLDEGVPVFSFTFGIPAVDRLARLRRAGTIVIGTATTVAEARRLAESPVDAVVAQGAEAGGHRGTFLHEFADALVGTMALVPQVVDAVGATLPVIAAGGIMDGRGVAAARMLGADGVAMGTAFLAAAEATTPPSIRAAVLAADETGTRVTAAYTGRPARALATDLMREIEAAGDIGAFPAHLLRHRDAHLAAVEAGDRERMIVYAGQGTRLATAETAAAIIDRVIRDSVALLGG
jgi:nitronate monooxygenase